MPTFERLNRTQKVRSSNHLGAQRRCSNLSLAISLVANSQEQRKAWSVPLRRGEATLGGRATNPMREDPRTDADSTPPSRIVRISGRISALGEGPLLAC